MVLKSHPCPAPLSAAEFSIWTREAGAGGLSIAVEGPSKAEIAFEDRKDGSCGVSYVVQEPGGCPQWGGGWACLTSRMGSCSLMGQNMVGATELTLPLRSALRRISLHPTPPGVGVCLQS